MGHGTWVCVCVFLLRHFYGGWFQQKQKDNTDTHLHSPNAWAQAAEPAPEEMGGLNRETLGGTLAGAIGRE